MVKLRFCFCYNYILLVSRIVTTFFKYFRCKEKHEVRSLSAQQNFFQEISTKVSHKKATNDIIVPDNINGTSAFGWTTFLWILLLLTLVRLRFSLSLSLYHCKRRQSGDNLDKILLVCHHLIYILVGTCRFIKMILRTYAVDDSLAIKHLDLLLE